MIFVIAFIGFILSQSGFNIFTTINDEEVVYTVPILASIRCEALGGTDTSPTYVITEQGVWISSQDIGAFTSTVDNIKVSIPGTYIDIIKNYLGLFGSFLGGVQVYYKACDENKQNCKSYIQSVSSSGITSLNNLPLSLDLRENSAYIVIQSRATVFNNWKNVDSNAKISYHYIKYGLVLYSPVGVGIETVCKTNCDLNCPSIGVREKMIATPKDSLTFGEYTNYISTWVDVSKSAEQLGGTIWIPSENQFCFGGFIYDAGEILTEVGKNYIYPKTYLRKESCCPGATISTQYEDKICQDDYTWETILKDTRIKCTSDFQCPNQGKENCRDKQLSGWSCSGFDSSIGSFCQENSGKPVECCSNSDCDIDQTCSNTYKCEGGFVIPPKPLEKCIIDSDCAQDDKCINGNCITPIKEECEWWNVFCKLQKLFSNLFSGTLNFLRAVKIFIIGVISLFTLFVSFDVLEGIRVLKRNKWLRWLFSLGLGLGVGILLFYFLDFSNLFFWITIGALILYIMFASGIKRLLYR